MKCAEPLQLVNNGFMRDGQLLEKEQIDKIRHIPATIVQGRYDCVCPAKTAWDLHKGKVSYATGWITASGLMPVMFTVWPEAKLVIAPEAGHNSKEMQIKQALIEATTAYGKL